MEIHIIEGLANSKLIGIPDPNNYTTQLYSFCKWSALIFALLASFTTLIKKTITRLQNNRLLSKPLLVEDDDDWSDIDYDTDTDISSCSEEEDDDSDVNDESSSSAIFRFKDSFNYDGGVGLRRRVNRSFGDLVSEFASGKTNVVRLWEENVRPIFDGRAQTPAVVVSTETTDGDGSFLKVWDTRVGSRIPEIMAEWTPKLGKIIGINGVGNVYVSDDVTREVKVADVRKVRSPLLTEVWWDANAGEVKDD